MSRARWIAALVFACTPHEHPQEPAAPCSTDAVLLDTPQRVCMDVVEVMTATYGACVQVGPCTPAIVATGEGCNLTRADRGDHPINCVTAHQAAAYCGWLGKRLPTDEEWKFVARGGARNTPFPWGRQRPDPTRACLDRTADGTCPIAERNAGASPEGVLDLVGNVEEWVQAGESWHLRGLGFDRRAADPIDLFAGVPTQPPDLATFTSGFRCVAAPHTPTQLVDVDNWTPHVPQPIDLPELAPVPQTAAPRRPASNFAILHHTPVSNDPPKRWWPLGHGFVQAEPSDPAALALTDPIDRAALPEALRDFTPVIDLGVFVLMIDRAGRSPRYIAFERATGKIRWQLALADLGTSYSQFVAPQTLVVNFYGDKEDTLIAFALASGREVWRLRGGEGSPFTRIRDAWSDDDRAYLIGDRGLLAFDPATGAVVWSGVGVDEGCGVTDDEGKLIVEDPAGHRLIDPATGKLERQLAPAAKPKRPKRLVDDDGDEVAPPDCRWNASSWDGGVAGAVIEGDLLLSFDVPTSRGTATLRALDLAAGTERWRRPGLGVSLLDADHDIVVAERTGEILVILDLATGQTRAEFSFAGPFTVSIEAGGGDAGPLLVVDTWTSGDWILGRAADPPVPESFTIRGRLVPEYLPRRKAAGVPVRVGEKLTRTDDRGRFEARGQALGAVNVALGSDRGPDVRGGLHVRFESVPVILEGRHSYDIGDVPLHEWYIE
jgi:outer membrane protein assembly factor BamB